VVVDRARSLVAGARHTERMDIWRPDFTVVVRGYDRAEVDAVLDQIKAAMTSDDPARKATLRQRLEEMHFTIRLRGYDRAQVDDWMGRSKAFLAL
jgi:DivIVA domain-containing protein